VEGRARGWWFALGLSIIAAGAAGAGGTNRCVALWIGCACVAVVALLSVVVGYRRLGPTRAGLDRPWNDPLALLAFGLVLLGGGVATGYPGAPPTATRIGDCLLIAALIILLLGVGGLLDERVRGYAADIVLEGTVLATTLGVTFWMLAVEDRLPHVSVSAASATAAVVIAGLALLVALASARLGVLRSGSATGRLLLAGTALVAVGRASQLIERLELLKVRTLPAAITVAGIGVCGAAVAHPGIRALRTDQTMAPVRLGLARLSVLILAVLVVPAITAWRLIADRTVEVQPVLVCSALLSLVVVVYLGGLLREWDRIEHRIQTDDLTGLPNRRHFHERLQLSIAAARRNSGGVAVLFLDLDRFKVINDSLGHAVGNTLLEAVARRISDSVPPGALAARLQGDEFAILLPDVPPGDPHAMDVARLVLRTIAKPYTLNRRKLYVTASAGIAAYPSDGHDYESLLRSADTAMYTAKDSGRNNAQVHTPEMHDLAVGRLDLESALHGAIERNELSVVYQPKVSLSTGAIVGCEALARWQHPDLGVISPVEFIEIAEETGLIVPLGEWVMQTACAQAKAWADAGVPPLVMAVNLSARQFQLQNVADMMAGVLRKTGANPELLEVELTESLAMQNATRVAATLNELVDMGVRCSIDDFGTGYSGLSYLARFPLSTIKIDKVFVQSIDNPDAAANEASIVIAIISMARGLGLRVVAEGVETKEQLDFLLRSGCDEIQGMLFSPPVTPEKFESLIMLERVAGGAGRLGKVTGSDNGGSVLRPVGRRLDPLVNR
jgi:diguanylate cyclase (GGDEF)-like protein